MTDLQVLLDGKKRPLCLSDCCWIHVDYRPLLRCLVFRSFFWFSSPPPPLLLVSSPSSPTLPPPSLWWLAWEWPHRLTCFNSWSLVGASVWQGLGGVTLLERVCHGTWWQDGEVLRFKNPPITPRSRCGFAAVPAAMLLFWLPGLYPLKL